MGGAPHRQPHYYSGPARRGGAICLAATEHPEGADSAQWMIGHPVPAVEAVRPHHRRQGRAACRAFPAEMLHQDLRPENIMTPLRRRIIDFGSTRVARIEEAGSGADPAAILGTAQYTARVLSEGGTNRSTSILWASIAYQMLTGRLPCRAAVARARTRRRKAACRLCECAGRRQRDSALARRRPAPGRASGPGPALRELIRIHPRPAAPESRLHAQGRDAADRTQPGKLF